MHPGATRLNDHNFAPITTTLTILHTQRHVTMSKLALLLLTLVLVVLVMDDIEIFILIELSDGNTEVLNRDL